MAFRVRAEGDATEGNAFVIGIDDRRTGKPLARQGYSMQEVGKDYVVLTNRNAFLMSDNPYVWFAGPNRPENEVKYIYIDELVIMVAE